MGRVSPFFGPEWYGLDEPSQRCGVLVECVATSRSENNLGARGRSISRLLGFDVRRVFEFAQVRDEIPRAQANHVLKSGKGKAVAFRQGGERGHDPESRGYVN